MTKPLDPEIKALRAIQPESGSEEGETEEEVAAVEEIADELVGCEVLFNDEGEQLEHHWPLVDTLAWDILALPALRKHFATPTQPPQGSQVERRVAVLKYRQSYDGLRLPFAAQKDAGPIWVKHGVEVMPVADLQTQLQRVEEERDRAGERLEGERIHNKYLANSERAMGRLKDEANEHATQAEARIEEAVEEFERRAKDHAKFGDPALGAACAAAYNGAANYLRSQPSSEEEEPQDDDTLEVKRESDRRMYARRRPDGSWRLLDNLVPQESTGGCDKHGVTDCEDCFLDAVAPAGCPDPSCPAHKEGEE